MLQFDARSRAFGRVIAVSTTAALVVGGVALGSLPASALPLGGPSTQELEVQLPVILGRAAVGQTVHALILIDLQADQLLAYQWKRNGVPIVGATGPAYTPTVADYGTNLTVSITVLLLTIPLATVTSPAATVGPGDIPLSPYPTVTGSGTVGSTLVGTPGTWTLNTGLSYQWYRGATPIAGATSLNYTLVPADLGTEVTLVTRGQLTGFITEDRASDPTTVTAGALSLTPAPTVTGSAVVGSTLTAATGTWDSGVTFSYQWKRDGATITGATGSSYDLVPADLNSAIRVSVTGAKAGYTSQTRSSTPTVSVAAGTISPAPVPTVTGAFAVGQVLTANPGTWAAGTDLSYAWLRDGVAIPGATGTNYTLVPADLGASVTVAVTGELAGYETRTTTSVDSDPVQSSMLPLIGTPVVTGDTTVGETLTAETGTWTDGVAFTYAWFRGATPIVGANAATYVLTPADAGAAVHVVVTGALDGYATANVASAATDPIDVATLAEPTDAVVTGSLLVGSTLTADPGTLPDGATLTYQWLRDGAVITGATDGSYTLLPADDGTAVSVRIVVTAAGYAPLEFTLDTAGPVDTVVIPVVGDPTVTGQLIVGSTLTAHTGTWSTGTTFDYQWTRDGDDIVGATDATHVLVAADSGTSIAVTVTGQRDGNSPATRSSVGTALIADGTLNPTTAPSASGSLAVGETLTADPGTWPVGTTFTYAWLRDGNAISGATGASYELTGDDLGAAMAVRVTAAKPGYTAVPTTVALDGTVVAQVIPVSSTPTVDGTTAVGRTLTAVEGDWTGDTTFGYVWKRDGAVIPGAASRTYALTADELGSDITVTVTGSNPPYAPVTRTSAAVGPVSTGTIASAPVPTIAGTASVGSTLQATAGTWPAGVTLAYQWYRGATPIAGATGTSYVPIAADVASALRVQVTGSAAGYVDRSVSSDPTAAVTAPAVDPEPTPTPTPTPTETSTPTPTPTVSPTPTPTPTATSTTPTENASIQTQNASIAQSPTPTISGTTTFQKVLTAVPGSWDAGVTLGYQWLRNGKVIAGSTDITHKLVLADIGTRLSVVVTGSRAGSSSVSVSSKPSATIAPKVFKRSPAPRITGTVAAGRTLTAKVQKWHAGVKFSYQWKANGKKIAKATHTTYKLTAKNVGKRITVTITAKLSGYKTLAKVSKKTVRVAR